MRASIAALVLWPLSFGLASAQSTADALSVTFGGSVFRFPGTLTTLQPLGPCGFTNLNSMAKDVHGRYVVSSGGNSATPAKLVEIDPVTGQGTLLGSLSTNGDVRGMAFDLDGSLLAIVRLVDAQLYRVDPSSLATTLIGATGFTNVQGLAVSPTGKIFGWDAGTLSGNGKGLLTLDRATGVATDVHGGFGGDSSIQTLSFDQVGDLYGLRNQLFRISTKTGQTTQISGSTNNDLRGFEFEHGMTHLDAALAVELDGTILRTNTSTGATKSLNNASGSNFSDMTRVQSTGEIVTAFEVPLATQFGTVDRETGSMLPIVTLALPRVRGLAHGFGVLYAVTDEIGQPDELWSISFSPPGFQLIGSTGAGSLRALAFNPMGVLYGWDAAVGLVRIDRTTGAATDVSALQNAFEIESLSFDPRGHLIGANNALGAQQMFEIDLDTGAPTPFGLGSIGDVRGLAHLAPYDFLLPQVYCTAQTNSAGCLPGIFFSGTGVPTASAGGALNIGAVNVLAGKSGLLFYGVNGSNSAPFLGGVLCVAPPLRRTPVQIASGGSGCSGAFAFDFNAYVASGLDSALIGGVRVDAQYWSRDPAAPATTNLTNALEFEIAP